MSTIGVISLGCAKNQVNSEQMLALIRDAGYELRSELSDCDAVVVNTCGFIESAKAEAIAELLECIELKAQGTLKAVIAAGCLAERYKRELLDEMPELDAIVGTGSYGEIVSVIDSVLNGVQTERYGDINTALDESPRILTSPGGSAYLKIAEGCDNHCAYCVIPSIRGRYRSRAFEAVISDAENLARQGVKELIVVAQDSTRYGLDLYGERRLPELLHKLSEIDGIIWIRLHYLYPDEISDALIAEVRDNPKIVKYLDIPVQHINSAILKAMNRRGDGEFIRRLFTRLRAEIPGLTLRTSVIVGLPGEGNAEFEELCAFLKEYKLERAGVFTYSPEEGTLAFDMPGAVHSELAEHRAALVEELQSRIIDEWNESRVGTTQDVLIEGYDEWGECYYGRTYADSPDVDGKVYIANNSELSSNNSEQITNNKDGGLQVGSFVSVTITEVLDGDVIGEAAL
ncbi:MAG: 30S ribosomal protein S12 methylthiotransferase RimO [Oscillospiraceae bacterium]|nr:30S ribosomal protein S12 methylthiotransferase RimO [Oscillospiraceae bacterium]